MVSSENDDLNKMLTNIMSVLNERKPSAGFVKT